ncbi:cyanophycinase [Flammeovirga pacifica]|uniref:Cyanophycinase n=1 Tax=Flammeovirga pacifica TaxID=915059 RepID=A0A1S1YTW8_FLAPC|nr:cyanophycinase [Flammeovirga pacifica]OHX64470.1 hypothetical protein NH26_23080 [Flammeovirga pacifica]
MRQYTIFLAVFVSSLFCSSLFAQSPLLLVGGGSEENGGWSDSPYKWFVEQSSNKKIAIISYTDVESDWLSNYFISLGAEEAKDFKIDRTGARNTQLIAELEAFDGFFFKGGDQNKYYNFYNNTAFKSLLIDKINEGAVLGGTSAGMAILSSVVYTADNGSLYPEDGLTSMDARYFTFADDFLQVLPNTLVDTHFAERGRMPRLISMLAYWKIHHPNKKLLGIGVDDRTALCIDPEQLGKVYGTGAVTFISLNETHNIAKTLPLDVANTTLISCVEGQEFDIIRKKKTSSERSSKLYNSNIYANTVTLLNGKEYSSQIEEAVSSKTLVIYDGIKQSIDISEGNKTLFVDLRKLPNTDLLRFKSQLQEVKKVVLLPFDSSFIEDFKDQTSVMNWLWNTMKSSTTEVVVYNEAIPFIGEKYPLNIYSKDNAAYSGSLTYKAGLGLLDNTMVFRDLYADSDYNENTASIFQETLFSEDINWSVGLTDDCEIKFQVNEKQWEIIYEGKQSSIIAENKTTDYSEANSRRAIVGYDSISTHVIYTSTLLLQEVNFENYQPTFKDVVINTLSSSERSLIHWKNDQLFFDNRANRNVQLIDLQGKIHKEISTDQLTTDLPLPVNQPMIIKVIDLSSQEQTTLKILRNK